MTNPTPETDPANTYITAAIYSVVAALLCVLYGVWVLYSEPPRLLGGDAYNYIVGALRGVAWIGVGGVFGGLGVIFANLGKLARND